MINKNKFNMIIFTLVFSVLIIGSSFAYFKTIAIDGETEIPIVSTIQKIGMVTLSGSTNVGEINVTKENMDKLSAGTNYTYPENGIPEVVATISASGDASDNITYYCTVDVTIQNNLTSGIINDGDAIVTYGGDLKSLIKQSETNIFNDINLVSTNGVLNGSINTTSDEFTIKSGEVKTLTKLVTINNTNSNQNNLIGLSFTTNTELTNLSCDLN